MLYQVYWILIIKDFSLDDPIWLKTTIYFMHAGGGTRPVTAAKRKNLGLKTFLSKEKHSVVDPTTRLSSSDPICLPLALLLAAEYARGGTVAGKRLAVSDEKFVSEAKRLLADAGLQPGILGTTELGQLMALSRFADLRAVALTIDGSKLLDTKTSPQDSRLHNTSFWVIEQMALNRGD